MKKILVFLFIFCFATAAIAGWSVENVLDIYVIKSSVIGKGGTIVPKGVKKVKKGENQTYYFVAYEGYKIHDIIIDNKSFKDMGNTGEGWESFTFTDVIDNHTIEVVFKKK
jgi:hypothetical protein